MPVIALQGCFTGIESTPAISDSVVKREKIVSKPEDSYLSGIKPQRFGDWVVGKQWYVTDGKIRLIFGNQPGANDIQEGDIILYSHVDEVTTVTGDKVAEIVFVAPSGANVSYRTSLSKESLRAAERVEVPFAVEMSVVDEVNKIMLGKTYYVVTSSWYDMANKSRSGRRFVPVKVTDVSPGNAYYPVLLTLDDEEGKPFRLFMSAGTDAPMPRRFGAMFALSDPRQRYPEINDVTWQHIVKGVVAGGMTREECRLALGAPATMDRRPGYSILTEIWTYEDGKYLIFEDGVLRSFRQ